MVGHIVQLHEIPILGSNIYYCKENDYSYCCTNKESAHPNLLFQNVLGLFQNVVGLFQNVVGLTSEM